MFYFIMSLVIHLLWCFNAIAEDEPTDPFNSNLTDTQKLLPTSIHSVSAISGQWIQSETDFVIAGPAPIVLTRSFSSDRLEGELGYNWSFNYLQDLVISLNPKYGDNGGSSEYLKASFHDSSGVRTVHKNENPKGNIIHLALNSSKGLTNCRSRQISARTNLHNTVITYKPNSKHCTAITGSGRLTHFTLNEKSVRYKCFSPDFEKLTNGHFIRFKNKNISAENDEKTKVYGWIRFDRRNQKTLSVKSSDGKTATYHFNFYNKLDPIEIYYRETENPNEPEIVQKKQTSSKRRYCLTAAYFSHKPTETYEYEHAPIKKAVEIAPNPLLKTKRMPNQRFQSVEYYKQGNCAVEGLESIRLSKGDFRINRVKEIKAPVGHDATPIVTHRFLYKPQQTDVYDAHLHKTRYVYNKKKRPTEIIHYLDKHHVYSKEKFIWNEEEKNKGRHQDNGEGNLIGKYMRDGKGNIDNALFFTYDSKGNILQERFYGNLTGSCTAALLLNENKQPIENGIECYKKTFSYSNDSFNLLTSELEENGKRIDYEYLPETDLISAKYLIEGETIRARQFFFYDADKIVIKVIKDDGNSRKHSHLNGVTNRTITHFVPRKAPPFGLPEQMTETYWDTNLNKEVQLSRVVCEYTSEGYLSWQRHFDANDNHSYDLFWEYDAHGNITREINAVRQEIKRCYDENDNLITEERPLERFEYQYDYANRLTQIIRRADGQTFVTEHRYDSMGNRIATIDSYGQQTHYFYDPFNRLIKTEYPPLLTTEGIISSIAEVAYDIHHHPILITQPDGLKKEITYNARGKPILKKNPDGTEERFEYYPNGSLAKSVATNGTYTLYKRDFQNRVISEEIYAHNHHPLQSQTYRYVGAQLIEKIDAEGSSTFFGYDGAARLISETCGKFHKTFSYDSLGNVARITEWYGDHLEETRTQTMIYDSLKRVIEEHLEDSAGNRLQSSRYVYDELGNRARIYKKTEQDESCTRIEYNADCKPIKIIDAKGNLTHILYHHDQLNSLGQRVLSIEKTDALGRKTVHIHDAFGQVREIIRKDCFGKILAKQEIFYDVMGRQTKTIDAVIVNGSLQRELINTWSYHPNGEEEYIIEACGTPEQKITRFTYNAQGQKERITKPDGEEIRYTYDPLGRVLTLSSSDGSLFYTYTYNLRHQITSVFDHVSQTETKRFYSQTGELLKETLGNSLSFQYDYDRAGRLKHFTLPDGSSIKYNYNAAYLKEIKRENQGKTLYSHKNILHDPLGNILQEQLIQHAGTVSYTYDSLGRNTQIKSPHWELVFTAYDLVNRLVYSETKDSAGTTDYTFVYNDLDHLQMEYGTEIRNYKTDSLQNRIQKNDIPCTINTLNQLTRQGSIDYTYDRNGNLIKKTQNGQSITYSYDALNRLIAVQSPTQTTRYCYDPFNRRITKIDQGIVSRFLYQGQDEIGCMNDKEEITELQILGTSSNKEIGPAIALELYGKTYAPLHDRQGQIICLLDIAGSPVETYRYTAFGEETIYNDQGVEIESSQTGNPWRFSGKRTDPETHLVYFGRRYYEPETGRWTTPDPLSFAEGPNLYAYLHHSPLNSYDAYGLSAEAYRDSCHAAINAPHYCPFADLNRSDNTNRSYSNFSQTREVPSNTYHTFAGSLHGSIDFFTDQACFLGGLACTLAFSEWEDPEEMRHFQSAVQTSIASTLSTFNDHVAHSLGCTPDHPSYQAARSYSKATMEIGSLAVGAYGLARLGYGIISSNTRATASIMIESGSNGQKIAFAAEQYVTRGGMILSRGAENINAGVNLSNKLSQLEKMQQSSTKTRLLPDGRIRYYSKEVFSKNFCPTRGASRVTEWNTRTGASRSWHECYDHLGNTNRVHPKQINGQEIRCTHYPLTARELGF